MVYDRSELDDELFELLSRSVGDAAGDLSPKLDVWHLLIFVRDHGGHIHMSEGEKAAAGVFDSPALRARLEHQGHQ